MSNSPEDYRCRHCQNLVLFRTDHKPDCRFYEPPFHWLYAGREN